MEKQHGLLEQSIRKEVPWRPPPNAGQSARRRLPHGRLRKAELTISIFKGVLDNFGGTGLSGDDVMNIVANVVGKDARKTAEADGTFETSGKNVQNIICSDNNLIAWSSK